MRARNLKPEFFRDRLIAGLAPVTRWVYPALWIVADDYGTAPLDAEQLKADLFMRWDDVTPEAIAASFVELQEKGRIAAHRAPNGELFARIINWRKHQRPKKPSQFRYPAEGEAVELEAPAMLSSADGQPINIEEAMRAAYLAVRKGWAARAAEVMTPLLQSPHTPTPETAEAPPPVPNLDADYFGPLVKQWGELVGVVNFGQVKKAFKAANLPPLAESLEAIRLFALYRKTLDERERGFQTFPKFAQDMAPWLEMAVMPLVLEDGTLTKKGALVSAS